MLIAHYLLLQVACRVSLDICICRILVLDKGKVMEFDSPGNLMDNPASLFHNMAKQAGILSKKS